MQPDGPCGRLTLTKSNEIPVPVCQSALVQLRTFFTRSIPLLVQVESQIRNVYASGALLTRFKSGDRQLDLPGQHLALKDERREVREVVSTYLFQRG